MTGHLVLEILGGAVAMLGIFATLFRRKKGYGISILIPFRCLDKTNQRWKNVEWLKRYWAAQLPGAEIIIGEDSELDKPFSKSVAVNNAASKAKGDIYVIVDADGYISPDAVLHCAEEIRAARKKGKRLWFVPYRQFYRLTEDASRQLLESDPANPLEFPCPPRASMMQSDTDPTMGHWYGAMIQIMSREAFEFVGGWDPRFRGWGGEDHAAMRAMDTIYGPHKTLPGQVLHVWHPQLGPQGVENSVHWKNRMWENQDTVQVNNKLSWRYYHASNKPDLMRKLLNEGHKLIPVTGNPPRRRNSM
jgi:glycosyltransferase involved in cell wall biosynthesis